MKKVILLVLLSAFAFAAISVDVKKLMQEGKKGNVEALNQLGFVYENGDGVPRDIGKAIKYYRQAAELGSDDAKLALSLLDLSAKLKEGKIVNLTNSVEVKGRGGINFKLTPNDLKDAIEKAKEGDKDALYLLAVIFDNGYGEIKANKDRALALYKKAAEEGSKKAKHTLMLLQEKK